MDPLQTEPLALAAIQLFGAVDTIAEDSSEAVNRKLATMMASTAPNAYAKMKIATPSAASWAAR